VLKASLTMPGEHDKELWFRMLKKLRMAALRAGVSYVYRVELQKRGVPHLHIVAWIPEGTKHHRLFSERWIEMLPPERQAMKGVARHCAVYEYFPQGDAGIEWFGYLVAHTSKSKKEQLGWKGKQWGVVGKQWMELKTGKLMELYGSRRARFQRVLRRMLSKPANNPIIGGRDKWKDMLRSLTPDARKKLRRDCRRAGHLPVRARRLPWFKGWSRIMDPDRLQRLIQWATSSESLHAGPIPVV
jgi:hypothetical protein